MVRAALADREIVNVKIGDKGEIRMDAFPGQIIGGTVIEMASAADVESGMFPIEVRFDSLPPRLVSGLVARLRLTPESAAPRLTYVPMAALVEGEGDRASVFVLDDGKALKREVRVAFITADSIALESGLSAGEPVITDGALYPREWRGRGSPARCHQAGGESGACGRRKVRRRICRERHMGLLEFPIRRYQFTLVAFLCLVALGFFAFNKVPREEDPYFKIPGFTIAAIYPGADPKDLERLVSKPIEDRLAALDDVMKMETSIRDGVSFTAIEFETFVDPDKKYDEVTREINALRPDFPAETQIIIRRFSPGLVNTIQVALVSDEAPYRELEDYARELKDVLKTVEGVRTSETWAYPTRELRIAVDLKRMSELNLSPSQVIAAVQSENANIPAGFIDLGPRSFSLKTSGSYSSLDQVRDTVIASAEGRIVRIRDVADVSWNTAAYSYTGRYKGKRAVFVTANQKDGYNILEVRERVMAAAQNFAANLPKRVSLQVGFDQSENVRNRLNRLYIDFGIAIALVLLTLLPLGMRAAGIVMISIPLSLSFGLACLYFLGYSLNQLSIAGFVVALGLLVDDSIVVVENIARHMRMGYTRVQAALAGTRQIFVAILGCTATLIFAFLPLLALPGTPGKFIRVLPMAVVATIIGSLLLSLFIIPFIASRVLSSEQSQENPFLRRVMGVIHNYYRPALHWCLARPKLTVAAALGGSLLLSAALVPLIGSSLFPKADTPQFLIQVESPNGTSLSETDRALHFVEDELRRMPEVRGWFSNLGHGNPQIYYNHITRNDAANYAEVFVQLHEYDTDETPQKLQALRERLERYPGRTYICARIRQWPADFRAHFDTRDRQRPRRHRAAQSQGRRPGEEHAGHTRRQEPAQRVAHQSPAAHRLAQGTAAGRADRRARSRGAPLGGGDPGRVRSRRRQGSNIPSWCARRFRSRRSSRRSSRCACPRSRARRCHCRSWPPWSSRRRRR